jgi:Protein of unknown function (DUF3306)
MAAEDDSNFFSRWSRRKVQVRTGEQLPAEPPVKPAAPVSVVVAPPATVPVAAPQDDTPAEQAPALTLEDVARLTPESDYSAFVARGVSPDVRNAAVKKLFTDPHYNVMDGLDIYIDDYSQPSPLSATEMARMVGAQFLKLVDDPSEAQPGAAAAAPPEDAPDTQATVAQQTAPEPHDPTASAHTETLHDDHADLQLQPDDVPEPPGSGRRAG